MAVTPVVSGNTTQYFDKFNRPLGVSTWEVTLTVATDTTEYKVYSPSPFAGRVAKVEIDPGTAMDTSATLKGFEKNTGLAAATRDQFLNYTFPASEVELVIYPKRVTTLNTGVETTDTYDGTNVIKDFEPYIVNGVLELDLESAVAGDAVTVRVYVER